MPNKTTLFCTGFLCGILITLLSLSMGGGSVISSSVRSAQNQRPDIHYKSESKKPGIIPHGVDHQGPYQGASDAAVTLVEYADYHCPYCARVEETIQQILQNYPGQVKRVWKHFPLPFHQGAEKTHQASLCAQDQGKFWEFHHYVFKHMDRLKSGDFFNVAATELGLNQGDFLDCVESNRYAEKVKADIAEGVAKGVQGTPATFVNGQLLSGAQPYEGFKAYVDHFLDPGTVPLPQEPKIEAPKPTVKAEFNDLHGKPSRGPADAPVTLVEFSDFHCPFCKRLAPTLDQLMQQNEGKIRRVWRHFPLPFHPGADRTHQAAACAHDQGKFWEFSNAIYENQEKLQEASTLSAIAGSVGLNQADFQACLESGKHRDTVAQDIAKAKDAGVQGTPSVFINGELITGAQPLERFQAMVNEKLKQS